MVSFIIYFFMFLCIEFESGAENPAANRTFETAKGSGEG